jgi:hypothetical protein
MYLSEKLAADDVTLDATMVGGDTDASGWQHYKYEGVFTCEGRTMQHEWEEGAGNDSEPTVLDVIAQAIRQSATAEAAASYEDWASDYTSDPDEYMPIETYRANVQLARDLRDLLGDERFEDFAFNTEHDD